MTKTILIDAAHREETRVAVLDSDILQDFDREAHAIKQIKGNIYLAKIIRVEASLQAAFVDYGGDRHGFLSFSDIHPDHYQLSEAEKQKIRDLSNKESSSNNNVSAEEERENNSSDNDSLVSDDNSDSGTISTGAYSVEDETGGFGGRNINNLYKKYNIQNVIKPGQAILVQVIKEARGNKGAGMTSYVSLAGRYCVLMANTPNKGGVSKKVSNYRDRDNLRTILNDLNVPSDKSVIIRTAGVGKRPEDIKRDYDYIIRLWNSIRDTTLNSQAPCFIHAEDDVIKRTIRDVYNDTVKEVIIEGKAAYDSIVNFAKLTMPESVNNIKFHDDRIPIFNKYYRVEQQISALYEKKITLNSGASIVIDNTEALVAIDVNSGRFTGETAVENTAYNTNLEAAKEIARQLKLRDLAGLIVIDFIDMYDQRNKRAVERALRDALRDDRARIQLGRISSFGLLEMSRQRLGASFFETITDPCRHCNGTGYVRSVEIVAVSILRAIRHSCADRNAGAIHIYTSGEVLSYILNFKRNEIISTEKNYDISILMHIDQDVGHNGFNIKKRKSLSDDERKELLMEVSTGKVNQLGIERDFIEEVAESDQGKKPNFNRRDGRNERNDPNKKFKDKSHYQNKKKKKFHHNDRDYAQQNRRSEQEINNSNSNNKKSLFGVVFDLFKKK